MRRNVLAVCGVAIGLGLAPAYAETLQMADAPQAQTQPGSPNRGMSMTQVEARYGTPSERVAPVGDPPISRWVYPGFTVYFEGHHVIHAVGTQPRS
jgi:hypothetical protein